MNETEGRGKKIEQACPAVHCAWLKLCHCTVLIHSHWWGFYTHTLSLYALFISFLILIRRLVEIITIAHLTTLSTYKDSRYHSRFFVQVGHETTLLWK